MVVKVQVTDPSKANPRKIPSAIFLVFFFIIRKKSNNLFKSIQLKILWKV